MSTRTNTVTPTRKAAFIAAFALGALATLGIHGGAVAAATTSPNSHVDVSQPATVDTDGTQGSFAPAIQGSEDSDGDQDAFATGSTEAVPQTKPKT